MCPPFPSRVLAFLSDAWDATHFSPLTPSLRNIAQDSKPMAFFCLFFAEQPFLQTKLYGKVKNIKAGLLRLEQTQQYERLLVRVLVPLAKSPRRAMEQNFKPTAPGIFILPPFLKSKSTSLKSAI